MRVATDRAVFATTRQDATSENGWKFRRASLLQDNQFAIPMWHAIGS